MGDFSASFNNAYYGRLHAAPGPMPRTMDQFSFDFGDPFYDFGGLRFAARLFTMDNTYAVDPECCTIEREPGSLTVRAAGLRWAGGQQRAQGSLLLQVRQTEDAKLEIRGSAAHTTERCKAFGILIEGLDICAVQDETGEHAAPEYGPAEYPMRNGALGLRTPLIFLQNYDGRLFFALSRDLALRAKRFAVYRHPISGRAILELIHEEDARNLGASVNCPAWQIGCTLDRQSIIEQRMRDLEQGFGLVSFAQRADVPEWFRDIRLVLNLHCEHWTGYVFNTFDRLRDVITWVARRIAGRQVLAFLPGWDGRYYYNLPEYQPSTACGGADGLRALIEHAHRLGVRVVPMYVACAGQASRLAPLGLADAVLRDIYGAERICESVDWDMDRAPDTFYHYLNVGHPRYRQWLYERICAVTDAFRADGAFLDMSAHWRNDPAYSPYEGTGELVRQIHDRFPEFLVFGENACDAQLAHFGVLHDEYRGYPGFFERYVRMAHYLAQPAPGIGSSGVHEGGLLHVSGEQRQLPGFIPTLAIVADSLDKHPTECERVINLAAAS
jgi:hypothetical protein